MSWRDYEPTEEEIERHASNGFEWDDERRAYLDVQLEDYVEPELIDRATHSIDMSTGELIREYRTEYNSPEDYEYLRQMQKAGWGIKSLEELDKLDFDIKWAKENG